MEEKKKQSKIPSGKKKVSSIKEKKVTPKKNNKDDELSKMNEKILRLSAELQNIKRRNDEEIARLCKYDGEQLILNLLTVIDDFERAININGELSADVSKFLSGFKMIYTNLLNVLDKFEITTIDALNKSFDPNCMEAVLTEKVDKKEPNIVLEVLQKGYIYKDKVIRPAMVKVSE